MAENRENGLGCDLVRIGAAPPHQIEGRVLRPHLIPAQALIVEPTRHLAGQGRTVLLSSHLMGELAETADDVVIIDRGRVVASGTLAEVVGDHPTLEDAFLARTTSTGAAW